MFRVKNDHVIGVSSVQNTITATAGGTQAAAYQLTASVNRVSVCATAADSVRLPPALAGCSCVVVNDGAASCQVFGFGTETIDAVATATGVAVANGKRRIFVCVEDGKWLSILGA
jgi:hypothetical protein